MPAIRSRLSNRGQPRGQASAIILDVIETILVATILLLLAVTPLLFSRGHVRQWTETAAARAYLDRLFGPAPRGSGEA
jgi:hypothetical protein